MPPYRYTKEVLEQVAPEVGSVRELLFKLKGRTTSSSTATMVAQRLKEYEIDTSHFHGQGWTKGKPSPTRKQADEILVRLPPGSPRQRAVMLRRALVESGVVEACLICGLDSWMEQELLLHIDHIDGDALNNRKENLRFLCPNCHSQTDTYGRRTR